MRSKQAFEEMMLFIPGECSFLRRTGSPDYYAGKHILLFVFMTAPLFLFS